MPEPHTLLMVVQGTLSGSPLERRLAGWRLADPCAQHVAHIDLIDLLPVIPACASAARMAQAPSSGHRARSGPLEGPHGGTFGRHNHDIHR